MPKVIDAWPTVCQDLCLQLPYVRSYLNIMEMISGSEKLLYFFFLIEASLQNVLYESERLGFRFRYQTD